MYVPRLRVESLFPLLQATNLLNQKFFKSPSCVAALAQVLTESDQWVIRQMAAVEMRKRIPKNWKKLDKPAKEMIKKGMVDFAMAEQEYVC
jgi:hypothetical protein